MIESLGKLFIGLGLAYYAVQHNFSDQAVAAMTVLGVTIGEVAAAVYMLIQGGDHASQQLGGARAGRQRASGGPAGENAAQSVHSDHDQLSGYESDRT